MRVRAFVCACVCVCVCVFDLAGCVVRKAVMRMRELVVPSKIRGKIRPAGDPTYLRDN